LREALGLNTEIQAASRKTLFAPGEGNLVPYPKEKVLPVSCKAFLHITMQTNSYNIADGGLAQEPFVANLSETFQDEMMFNLDFLDDRAWTSGLGEVPLFGGPT
jgi:hypothetical protein